MKLNERVVIISEANMSRLLCLYGKVDIDELSRVVNNHLEVAIDAIEEDCLMQKEKCCSDCEFMKMYDYGKKIYYCDHEDRIDDIGKLSVENPSKTSSVWCSVKKFDNPHSINKFNVGLGVIPECLLRTVKGNEQTNTGDIIQMNTNISLTDRYGNVIEVKVPEPEYVKDSIF